MKERYKIKVAGKVQGVFFRKYAQLTARKLGVYGWVENDQDGGVSIEAEGEKEDVKKFIEWCHKGPPLAKVDRVNSQKMDTIMDYSDFDIQLF